MGWELDTFVVTVEEEGSIIFLKIPPKISDKMGWEPGDTLVVTVEEGSITLKGFK